MFSYPDGNPVQPTPVPHPIEQNLCSYPIYKSEQPSQPLQLFGLPIPTRSWEHDLKWSATVTGKQDFPVKWFKFIHISPKPRMTETPVQRPVHVAYSSIATMNYQWTINLHDRYPLLQGMQLEEYIPTTFHTLSNHKPTIFHLDDDYLCTTKILLSPGDNGENMEAVANEESMINDDLYKLKALIGHQRPPKAPNPNLKRCK